MNGELLQSVREGVILNEVLYAQAELRRGTRWNDIYNLAVAHSEAVTAGESSGRDKLRSEDRLYASIASRYVDPVQSKQFARRIAEQRYWSPEAARVQVGLRCRAAANRPEGFEQWREDLLAYVCDVALGADTVVQRLAEFALEVGESEAIRDENITAAWTEIFPTTAIFSRYVREDEFTRRQLEYDMDMMPIVGNAATFFTEFSQQRQRQNATLRRRLFG